MKIRLIVFLIICSNTVIGQYSGNYSLDFDDQDNLYHLYIDTVANNNNIWEIGNPNKVPFKEAFSSPNAICTDLDAPYRKNDTSTFIINNLADGGFENSHTVILSGRYKMDTDSLKDFGILEFSPDNGTTWVDLLTDTVYKQKNCYEWWSEEPVFTGSVDEWREFHVWLAGFGPEFNIGGWQMNDTVKYRFTFISDSIQTNKAGWILDDLHFEDWVESINNRNFVSFKSTVYPNPTADAVTIRFSNKEHEVFNVSLFRESGALQKSLDTNSELVEIDLNELPSGIYYYRIKHKNKVSTGNIVKQ